jgi:hypothetical protein
VLTLACFSGFLLFFFFFFFALVWGLGVTEVCLWGFVGADPCEESRSWLRYSDASVFGRGQL